MTVGATVSFAGSGAMEPVRALTVNRCQAGAGWRGRNADGVEVEDRIIMSQMMNIAGDTDSANS